MLNASDWRSSRTEKRYLVRCEAQGYEHKLNDGDIVSDTGALMTTFKKACDEVLMLSLTYCFQSKKGRAMFIWHQYLKL
jgi:hypothetical protein